jgi:hypothetical protein
MGFGLSATYRSGIAPSNTPFTASRCDPWRPTTATSAITSDVFSAASRTWKRSAPESGGGFSIGAAAAAAAGALTPLAPACAASASFCLRLALALSFRVRY